MSFATDVLTIVKKIFLVSDELTRVSAELKDLTRTVNNHDVRLAVIENTLSMSTRAAKLTLPGN